MIFYLQFSPSFFLSSHVILSLGPMGDTYYALLSGTPDEIAERLDTFHLAWQTLDTSGPGAREMHGSAVHGDALYITGGRDGQGRILNDVWRLVPAAVSLHHADIERTRAEPRLSWEICPALKLTSGCCAHSSVLLSNDQLINFGGFQESSGISSTCSIISVQPLEGNAWITTVSDGAITERFGHCACPVLLSGVQGVLLFGGVNTQQDLSDLWLIYCPRSISL